MIKKFTKNNLKKTPGLSWCLSQIRSLLTSIKLNHVYLSKIGIPLSKDILYQTWLCRNYPNHQDLLEKEIVVKSLNIQPLFSILMPVFNTPKSYLEEAIDSVIAQVYPYWELCIVDDASTNTKIKKTLDFYTSKDKRIKVKYRSTNGHISQSSNDALAMASGDFIALLDHDDLLASHALLEVAIFINKYPNTDFIYSDEDKIDEDGYFRDPYFKPEWSPDTFLSKMYTSHLGIYRTSLIRSIGGFRLNFEGSQDYDLVLRVTEVTSNIAHIPDVLYHWRIHPASTASTTSNTKPYAYEVAKLAIKESLIRRGEVGHVHDVQGYLGHYLIRYELPKRPKVSIIIPSRDQGKILNQCLLSIVSKSTYENYEILLIDNGTTDLESLTLIKHWQKELASKLRVIEYDIPFNYSRLCNFGANQASGEYLLFLNNDTEVISNDWIEAMLEQAMRKTIGAVGAKLLYPDYTIQHAGVVLGLGGVAAHSHRMFHADEPGYYCCLKTVSNYSAVTGACLMLDRNIFFDVNGFDEVLSVAYNDIDLCLKVLESGYYNVYIPHAELLHHESKSRGLDNEGEKLKRFNEEKNFLIQKWRAYINNDPFYSPHLTRCYENFSIKI